LKITNYEAPHYVILTQCMNYKWLFVKSYSVMMESVHAALDPSPLIIIVPSWTKWPTLNHVAVHLSIILEATLYKHSYSTRAMNSWQSINQPSTKPIGLVAHWLDKKLGEFLTLYMTDVDCATSWGTSIWICYKQRFFSERNFRYSGI